MSPMVAESAIDSQVGRSYSWTKSCLDWVGSIAVLAFFLPLMVIIGLLIRTISPGPVFHFQEREGLRGRRIRIVKFRTMHVDAERRLRNYLDDYPALADEWARTFKLRSDPRVIPFIGCLLRKSSLDELPQIWNVLRGEMSLIGPRPLPDYHLDKLDPAFRGLRRCVRPGITGLWQVGRCGGSDLADLEELDTEYVLTQSLKLDLQILMRTIGVMMSMRNA